jgi:glycosyltransferase involved in cell wall biosynthesis
MDATTGERTGGGSMRSFEGEHFVFLTGYIGQLGGAERQALILAQLLRDEAGANVSFLGWSLKPGLMTDLLNAAGIPIYIHPLAWGDKNRNSLVSKVHRLARFTLFTRNRVKPDYLLPYIGENSKVAGLIWRASGARYTWWNQRDEGREIYGSKLERWLVRKIPDVVSNSWAGRDFLVNTLGVPFERVRVINNAVILPAQTDGCAWRTRLGLGAEDRLVVMVANLTRYKDHETLLRAFSLVQRRAPRTARYHLALAGRPEETEQYLKALAFDLGLGGCVRFLGAVSNVGELYDAADLVVHSSIKEGCPNAVLEGMAHGRCVVGTDISGLRQALGDGSREQFLAPEKNPEQLAERIMRWLGDDEGRFTVGELNRARIETEFSSKRLLASVLNGIAEHATDRAS